MQTLYYTEHQLMSGSFYYLLCDYRVSPTDVQIEIDLCEYLSWLMMFARQSKSYVKVDTKQVSSWFDFRSM